MGYFSRKPKNSIKLEDKKVVSTETVVNAEGQKVIVAKPKPKSKSKANRPKTKIVGTGPKFAREKSTLIKSESSFSYSKGSPRKHYSSSKPKTNDSKEDTRPPREGFDSSASTKRTYGSGAYRGAASTPAKKSYGTYGSGKPKPRPFRATPKK